MMDRGGGPQPPPTPSSSRIRRSPSTPAGQARSFVRMDGAYLLGFGPRTAEAVRELAAALYGDAIKKLITAWLECHAAFGYPARHDRAGIACRRRPLVRGPRIVHACLLCVVLAGDRCLFSLASGASDASAFAVVRDWLLPVAAAADRFATATASSSTTSACRVSSWAC